MGAQRAGQVWALRIPVSRIVNLLRTGPQSHHALHGAAETTGQGLTSDFSRKQGHTWVSEGASIRERGRSWGTRGCHHSAPLGCFCGDQDPRWPDCPIVVMGQKF